MAMVFFRVSQIIWKNMNEQITLFDPLGDTESVSPRTTRGDTKKRAIQKYLNEGKIDPKPLVNRYTPNGRKTQYFRLDYWLPSGKKSIHIKGGNTSAKLANYRAKKLQKLIDRGAELLEVLEQLADFNGGTSNEN